jgi:transposase
VGTMESETRIGEPARRQHGRSFKASLVEQSLQSGASVAVIARNNGINANLLFKWRRAHGRKTTATSLSTAAAPTVLLPIHVEPVTRVGARSALESTGRTHRQGVPEVGIEPSHHPDRSRIWAGVPDVRAAMGHTPRSSSWWRT